MKCEPTARILSVVLMIEQACIQTCGFRSHVIYFVWASSHMFYFPRSVQRDSLSHTVGYAVTQWWSLWLVNSGVIIASWFGIDVC